MSNSYFRFKQFTIHQDKCAMKVSTDACIQGAWTQVSPDVSKILDVGTGTGLLSLMLAQKAQHVIIDAIELDTETAQQARENVVSSPWHDRVNIINADAITYDYKYKYELIISNPPFFSNSLLGEERNRNIARHTLTLDYENLFSIIKNNLAEGGHASILLPYDVLPVWQKILDANNWVLSGMLLVHARKDQQPNRVVAFCSQYNTKMAEIEHLDIRNEQAGYSQKFSQLLDSYYL